MKAMTQTQIDSVDYRVKNKIQKWTWQFKTLQDLIDAFNVMNDREQDATTLFAKTRLIAQGEKIQKNTAKSSRWNLYNEVGEHNLEECMREEEARREGAGSPYELDMAAEAWGEIEEPEEEPKSKVEQIEYLVNQYKEIKKLEDEMPAEVEEHIEKMETAQELRDQGVSQEEIVATLGPDPVYNAQHGIHAHS